jgi:hypothetical protein
MREIKETSFESKLAQGVGARRKRDGGLSTTCTQVEGQLWRKRTKAMEITPSIFY